MDSEIPHYKACRWRILWWYLSWRWSQWRKGESVVTCLLSLVVCRLSLFVVSRCCILTNYQLTFTNYQHSLPFSGRCQVWKARSPLSSAPPRIQGLPRTTKCARLCQGPLLWNTRFLQPHGHGLAWTLVGRSVQQVRTTILPQDCPYDCWPNVGACRTHALASFDSSRH